MEFTEMKNLLLQLQQTDYRNFVKALVAIETNCKDEEKLESSYEKFMEEDEAKILDILFYQDNLTYHNQIRSIFNFSKILIIFLISKSA